MVELADQPEETFTAEFITTLIGLLRWLIQGFAGNDVSTVYSALFFKWYLASKSVSWEDLRMN
jgi:hypothetical protein